MRTDGPLSGEAKKENDRYYLSINGIGVFTQTATGKYAYTVCFDQRNSGSSKSGAFVRAADTVAWDPGLYGNVAYSDDNNVYGDSGIYYNVKDAVLTLYIKSVNPENPSGYPIINEITVNGVKNEITVVDLENVIYFLSGTKTVAKVELEGNIDYEGFIFNQARRAYITTWNYQDTVIIEYPLITNDLRASYFGLGTRGGNMAVNAVSLKSAENVYVNDNVDDEAYITLDKYLFKTNELIKVNSVGYGVVALYKGDTLVMHYKAGKLDGFNANGGNAIIDGQTLLPLKAGEYTIKYVENDSVVSSFDITLYTDDDPVSLFTPEDLVRYAEDLNCNMGNINLIPYELNNGYITFINDGSLSSSDYNMYLATNNPDFTGADFFAIRYRTTAENQKYELFLGTATYAWPKNVQFSDKIIADGNWHTAIIDFSEYGMDKVAQFRLDLLNRNVEGGATIDVAWMGFFDSSEAAENYSKVKTIDCAEVDGAMMTSDTYFENGSVMVDGQAQEWLQYNKPYGISGVSNCAFRGWISFRNSDFTVEKFGYSVDGDFIYWDIGFSMVRPDVSAVYPNSMGYQITVDVDRLTEGEHTIELVVLATDGNIYSLSKWGEIKVIAGKTEDTSPSTGNVYNIQENGRMMADAYFENGKLLIDDGRAETWFINNIVDGTKGVETAGFRGWASISNDVKIAKFGYIIDDNDPVYNDTFMHERADVVAVGMPNGKGYQISVDLTTMEKGEHIITFVALGSDGNLYALDRWGEIRVVVGNKDDNGSTDENATSVKYDFTSLKDNGVALTNDTALTTFNNCASAKCLASIEVTKIFSGNSAGGAHPNEAGLIKTGTSHVAGKIVMSFGDKKVTKIEIKCHDFYKKSEKNPTNTNTVSVNGSEAQLSPYNETGAHEVTTFDIEASSTVTIDVADIRSTDITCNGGRITITEIIVYFE